MSTSAEKIGRILRADKDTVFAAEAALSEFSGRRDILDSIVRENEKIVSETLKTLYITDGQAREIYNSLLERIQEDDAKVSNAILGRSFCENAASCRPILAAAESVVKDKKGFFLKKEKARELLEKQPPLKIMQALGYSDIKELLSREDLFEIFSALRFVEDADWLNNVFFSQYEELTPDDFEEREIATMLLSDRWKDIAEKFLKKKHHNISHLKELGVIFVLPAVLGIKGETLRTLALVFHYFHEIIFYSKLFKKAAVDKDNFSQNLVSFLRGDVLDSRFPQEFLGKRWLIIQRYLAKDDENDWRLFEPHVNPEAVHWKKAEADISELGGAVDSIDLTFWKDLDWVGDYFSSETGTEFLISFNLVDTVMSLVKKKEMIKYLYHHQEALWNKIFYTAVGEEKMEQKILDNWDKGYIELT